MTKVKSKLFTMKVQPDKLQKYHKLAKSYNLTLAKLIKDFLDNQELPKQYKIKPKPFPEVDPVLMRKISGAVNNLNQISRRVNEDQKFDVALALASIDAQLEEIRHAHQIH